jgi:hypothetical protein
VAEEIEDKGYLPSQTDTDRIALLRSPVHSIRYIAAIMRAGADVAAEFGFIINDRPEILTEFYQGWTLDKWRAHFKSKPKGSVLIAADAMAVWVMSKLSFLEDGVGKPDITPASSDIAGKFAP